MISGITSDKRVKSFGIVWADTGLAQQKTIRQKRPEQYLMFLKAAVMLLLIMDMILIVFKFLLSIRKDSFFVVHYATIARLSFWPYEIMAIFAHH